jgi:hypothetical protein
MSLATVFRVLLLGALATHVFYMYGLARTMGDGFGLDAGRLVAAALFAGVMLLPLVWAVTLPDLPEIITNQVRGRMRWSQGRCPTCGYEISRRTGDVCPECGAPAVEPARGYRITGRTVRRYILLNLLAWIIGCAASETWISADESAFRVEAVQARQQGYGYYVRAVRWPGRGLYHWEEGVGCTRVRGAGRATPMSPPAGTPPA